MKLSDTKSSLLKSYEEALSEFSSLLKNSHAVKGDYPSFAFEKLPPELQAPVLNALQEWVRFFAMNAGTESLSEKQLLWRFLGIFRIKPESDFFSKIDDQTCVEVINRAGLQTFRSLSFMSVCSYSLDEIISVPWPELYRRDEDITSRLIELQGSIADGTLKHRDLSGLIPIHKVIEISGVDKLSTTIQPMYLSPLYDALGAVVGAVHAFRILECKSLKSTPV